MTSWPYPFWIAHRGAGKLAPENTLAAFRQGAALGWRMFECDVQLSADGVPFLLHDATLERTTNGQGPAGARPWTELARLDAGGWHSSAHAGEPLSTLEAVARFCIDHDHCLNIEIKPSPGTDRRTGETVAREAARLWQGSAVPPLLSSFQIEALDAAHSAVPNLPRGLLLETLPDDWLATALQLQCVAVIGHFSLWNAATVAQAHDAGLRVLSYTVNDADLAQTLITLGLDGLITDRMDFLGPTLRTCAR